MLLENLRFNEGETKQRPGVRGAALLARRRVRERRVRRVPPRARVDRRTAGDAPVGRRSAAAAGDREPVEAARSTPERPYVVVLGGAKVADKIGVVKNLLDRQTGSSSAAACASRSSRRAAAQIGESLIDEEAFVEVAVDRLGRQAHAPDRRRRRRRVRGDGSVGRRPCSGRSPSGMLGLDIGPATAAAFAKEILGGEDGVLERPDGRLREAGLRRRNDASSPSRSRIVPAYHRHRRRRHRSRAGGTSVLQDAVDFASTGGGASLEFLEGKDAPRHRRTDGTGS